MVLNIFQYDDKLQHLKLMKQLTFILKPTKNFPKDMYEMNLSRVEASSLSLVWGKIKRYSHSNIARPHANVWRVIDEIYKCWDNGMKWGDEQKKIQLDA